ncbi:MAG: Mth938-like domain-containing protein [Rhodospirillales bacterium]|nr:Mth938-like domain-containing protein [Rhodospirillales bacterium]MDE0710535.1 Mth938-like domain-containing protein [Rhodospirillales bacterium]
MRGPPEEDGALVRVDGYGPTGFTISGRRLQGPVILRANEAVVWAGFSDSGLEEAAARDLLADFRPPGIVLVGTGQSRVVPGTSFLAWFRTRGFEPDLMATGAACRTWNVLAMEGREVIAGLIPSGWVPGQETES